MVGATHLTILAQTLATTTAQLRFTLTLHRPHGPIILVLNRDSSYYKMFER
jgi:hypothetical protein